MIVKYRLRTMVNGEEKLLDISAEEAKPITQSTKLKSISFINKVRARNGISKKVTDIIDGLEVE